LRRLAVLLIALLPCVVLAACAPATVTRVVDGDTVEVVLTGPDPDGLLTEGTTYRVRLIGIDTPEVYGGVECYGPEASAYTKGLLAGREVMLEKDVSNTDRYGRLLRYLWADTDPGRPGLELVNAEIVRTGYATVSTYPPDVKYVDRFVAAEQYARDNDLGVWGSCPVEPGGPPPSPTPSSAACDPSYPSVCIPPPPPDLDCGQIPHRNFQVLPPDPHGFDGDHDGIGCEG
jgi:micrococcal nuclease